MDFWQRARNLVEDAAKRSQELVGDAAKRSQDLAEEAAKRSQDFTIGSSKLYDIVLEASKRSKEMAVEASKKADLIKFQAMRRADQIKAQIPATSTAISQLVINTSSSPQTGGALAEDLEKFGVTDELREFVRHITSNTFRDFPMEDDSEMSDVPTVSNVQQDLTKWQEIHAKLVLSTVKEISKLSYEKRYTEEEKQKPVEEVKQDAPKRALATETVSKTDVNGPDKKNTSAASKTADQDLDVFLLGDLGDSDEGPDNNGDEDLEDDDLDKL